MMDGDMIDSLREFLKGPFLSNAEDPGVGTITIKELELTLRFSSL